MDPEPPVIQVLSKADYRQQYLLPLPSASLPPLSPSSIRIKTAICSLTANNTTYAKLGDILGWWNVHSLPSNIIPAEYSDSAKYGRVSTWGYAQVLESTHADLPAGSAVYGYLPIGTLPVDLQLESPVCKGHFTETSPDRSRLLPIYNRYVAFAPGETEKLPKDFLGWSSLMMTLFETSYTLNKSVFAWEEKNLAKPTSTNPSWTLEQANLTGSIVIVLAASGKTALSFAHQLRNARPTDVQPLRIVAVGSDASRGFAEDTGFYDQVLNYNEPIARLASTLGIKSDTKMVLCDFGSRGNTFRTWLTALKPTCRDIIPLGVGSEPKVLPKEELIKNLTELAAMGRIMVNASDMRDQSMKNVGEEKYFQDFLAEWKAFVFAGAIPGVSLEWGEGMGAMGKVWDLYCSGEAKADKGYVFEM